MVLTESMTFADGSIASRNGMQLSLNGMETAQPRIPMREPLYRRLNHPVVKAL